MEMQDIIIKKRDGMALSEEEIRWFIREYTEERIPDYQISALLMAIYFQGMTEEETFVLTDAMEHSGDLVELHSISGTKVDKHSTGGVGDKTTLIVGPIAAACGVPVAKMSGRGLGFSGGTADKLEAIPGYRTELSEKEFFKQVNEIGISLITQTGHITPADKKIYALRDVTGTVENRSLIAASIMSKKLAAGSDAVVLDVKCGRGAFMKDEDAAWDLAQLMCTIGKSAGKSMSAVITDMDQPLGYAVGNALEVKEAIDTLEGYGPQDVTDLCIELAGRMIWQGNRAETLEEGRAKAADALRSGKALSKFRELLEAQGGDTRIIENQELLPESPLIAVYSSEGDGYISDIDPYKIGVAAREAGAGRENKEDVIDPGAGVLLHKKKGDPVRADEVLVAVYGSQELPQEAMDKIGDLVSSAITISDERPEIRPVVWRSMD